MKAKVEITIKAIKSNFNFLQKTSGKKIICVVKCDAYGHGSIKVAKALETAGAHAFAVSDIEEAITLRKASVNKDILILYPTSPIYAKTLYEYGLTQSLTSYDYAANLNDACRVLGVKLPVHVKLDTGMHRFGFSVNKEDLGKIEKVFTMQNMSITGLYTHFSSADDRNSPKTEMQIERFYRVKNKYFDGVFTHLSNSAALSNYREINEDACRIGLALYGFNFDKLTPAMSLKTEICGLTNDPFCVGVGYLGEKYFKKAGEYLVLPLGYANGFFPSSNRFKVTINQKEYPIVGKVCMNHSFVSVSGDSFAIGESVAVLKAKDDFSNLASATNAPVHQILTHIGNLNDRLYVD